jgi:hypothetical protein
MTRRLAFLPLFLVAAACGAPAAPAAAPTAPTAAAADTSPPPARADDERFDLEVRGDFFAGLRGDAAALDRAMTLCEQTLADNPEHAEAMVWHGAGLVARSGAAFRRGDQTEGRALWDKGMAEMDRAVELEPENVGVRIPRGAALINMAPFLPPAVAKPLLEKGVGDFETTLALQQGYFDTLPVHARGQLLFGLASGWDLRGDRAKATYYYKRLRDEAAGTAYAKRAEKWLAGDPMPAQTAATCGGCHG